jgi:N-acyl-D-glutamate deacylase
MDLARIIGAAAVACGLLAAAIPAVAQDYDLVILNGRVMDPETRYDAIANVGIKDGTIVVITALELESGVLPIGDWYDAQAAKDLPINYGAAAAWTFGRIAAFSDTDPLATSAYFQDAQAREDWKQL